MRAVYVGFDAGSTMCEVVAKTKAGEPAGQRRFPTSEAEIRKTVELIPGRWHVNVESSELSGWIVGILRKLPQVERVVVSNPKTNAWIARDPLKSDRRDAEKLCDQLRLGVVDEVYCGDDPERETFKQIVQHYDDLNDEQKRLKSKIKSRYRIQGVIAKDSGVFLSDHREEYLSRVPSVVARESIRHLHELLDQTLKAREKACLLMTGQATKYPEIKRFVEVPGIGPILACRFSAYVQTPFRFRNKRKLIRYCRLGIVDRSSDGKPLGRQRLDRNGHGRLKDVSRKAFLAATSSKEDNAFKRTYRGVLNRTHNGTHARLTVQRKILTTLWAMWKGGTRYQDDKG